MYPKVPELKITLNGPIPSSYPKKDKRLLFQLKIRANHVFRIFSKNLSFLLVNLKLYKSGKRENFFLKVKES